jgi:hypothetical protein
LGIASELTDAVCFLASIPTAMADLADAGFAPIPNSSLPPTKLPFRTLAKLGYVAERVAASEAVRTSVPKADVLAEYDFQAFSATKPGIYRERARWRGRARQ